MEGLSSDDELSPKEQAHATSAKKEVMEQAKRWETPLETTSFLIYTINFIAEYCQCLSGRDGTQKDLFLSHNFPTSPNIQSAYSLPTKN